MKKALYNGINIQFPISRMIVEGKKVIETRTYSIPAHYIGQEMALVETPGRSGNFKSRIIGIIKFGPSFQYKSKKEFYADTKKHCVTPESPWAWNNTKNKWGWPVQVCHVFTTPRPLNKRSGIKFTKDIEI
jgi:hypothetical protein